MEHGDEDKLTLQGCGDKGVMHLKCGGHRGDSGGMAPAASLAFPGLCQPPAPLPRCVQSLPHAHLHAKLPALAGELGLPPTLPLPCRLGKGLEPWGCPHGSWGQGEGHVRLGLGTGWVQGAAILSEDRRVLEERAKPSSFSRSSGPLPQPSMTVFNKQTHI